MLIVLFVLAIGANTLVGAFGGLDDHQAEITRKLQGRTTMTTAVPPKTVKTPLNLPKHRGAFYGGKWHEPKNGRSSTTSIPAPASRSARSPIAAPTISTPR